MRRIFQRRERARRPESVPSSPVLHTHTASPVRRSWLKRKHQTTPPKDDPPAPFVIITPSKSIASTTPDEATSPEEEQNRRTQQATALDQQGNQHFEKREYDLAFLCYEQALMIKRNSLKSTQDEQKESILASLATSINNMTYLQQRAGHANSEEIMASYLKSLQIKREILGPEHVSVGKTLNNIGSVFYLRNEYVPALRAYQDAREIMQAQLGADHVDVGTVISNCGDVYLRTGEKDLALLEYRRALQIRWNCLGKNDPKVIRLMEQVAALETGNQPQKHKDDLSDSEDEEFANEDRARDEAFQLEVQTLQDELVEDIKFFDLMERQMAIDFVKDKTRLFREMRHLERHGVLPEDEVPATTTTIGKTVVVNESLVVPVTPSPPRKPVLATKLSVEERKSALESVKDRLSHLRASRGFTEQTTPEQRKPTVDHESVKRRIAELKATKKLGMSNSTLTKNTPSEVSRSLAERRFAREAHRSYMMPTASSTAKTSVTLPAAT